MKYLSSGILPLCISTSAFGQVAEIRAGIGAHDIRVVGDGIPVREDSVLVNAEIIFEEPEFLKWAFSPQPYINGSLNLGGSTSYAGAGLLWRQNFGKKFYGDFGFGLVIHNGTLDVLDDADDIFTPDLATTADFQAAFDELFFRRNNNIEYGSRVLFREQLTLGYKIDPKWAVEGYFEHISHGGLLSDRSNDGSDAAGFRIKYGF